MSRAKASDSVIASLLRANDHIVEGGFVLGIYDIEVIRDGEVVHKSSHLNTVTTEGLRYLLDAALDNSAAGYTEKTTWYVMLISNDTAASASYTYDSFLDGDGATEFTSYSGGVRLTWNGALDGSAASITNSASKAAFGITGSGTLYGAALVSNNTLSDHTSGDYLYSYSKFAASIAVVNGDTVNVTVTLSLS